MDSQYDANKIVSSMKTSKKLLFDGNLYYKTKFEGLHYLTIQEKVFMNC